MAVGTFPCLLCATLLVKGKGRFLIFILNPTLMADPVAHLAMSASCLVSALAHASALLVGGMGGATNT